MAYAVIHPEGVLLFDTGIGFGNAEIEAAYRPVVRDVPRLLQARGISAGDVVALANSHLHFDHCGQNGAFVGRPIREWVDFPGSRYELVDGESDVLRGVRLVPTPGHTAGHQSMMIEAAEARTALVGQAVYTRAEWDGDDGPGVSGSANAWDRAQYRRSVERIRAFRPDVVLFGHDR
jgi:glyoxylase-like metal-dependent hydrolase (beta-lactamase superfamily II)